MTNPKTMTQEEIIDRIAEVRELLTGYDDQAVYDVLRELGGRNTQPGGLELMDYQADLPFHQLENALVRPAPIGNAELAEYGPAAHPHFDVISLAWREHPDLLRTIAGEVELPSDGRNYTVVTNHSNVIDIALVLGGLRLEIQNWLDPMRFSQRSTLIISRGITTTTIKLQKLNAMLPAVSALQLFTHVGFSFPTTPTVRSKGFPDGLVPLANELIKLELEIRLREGGHILGVAPSASKDLVFSEKVHMQPLHHGTMQLMRGWLIPVAVTLDGEEPACKVLPHRYVYSNDDCHQAMHEIARECHRQTLVPHKYHDHPQRFERILEGVRARQRGG